MTDLRTVRMESIDEEFSVWTHTSGLTVFMIPKMKSEQFAVLTVRFGSDDLRFRPDENSPAVELPNGVAHFLEHKMFENEDGTDTFSLFAQTGAFANAFTSRRSTSYLFSCTEEFDTNLRILLGTVTHPFFSADTVAKEQGIIGEEIDMHTSPPGAEVHRNLLSALYHVHPVRNEICGTRESISRITPEMLYACTDAFYRPSNMSLVIAGDVEQETVRRICDEMLPPDPTPFSAVRIEVDEPETVRETRIEKAREVAQPLICIGFKSPPPPTSEELLVSAANAINMQLLFGRSGDFFNRLYEKGVISEHFGADFLAESGYAFTKIAAACDDPDLFFEEVRSEIVRRLSVYYTDEEFETARRVIYVDNIYGLDSVEDAALTCSDCWIHGYDHLQWLQVLMRVTPEEAFDVFRKTVVPDRCSVSIILPQKDVSRPDSGTGQQ